MATFDIKKLIQGFKDTYRKDIESLGEEKIQIILKRGRKYNLSRVLESGGVLTFPHGRIFDFGYQTAAVVHAALDAALNTGRKKILFIAVLHPFNNEAFTAMQIHENPVTDDNPLRHLYGGGTSEWDQAALSDHSTIAFQYLYNMEVKNRKLQNPPKIIIRSPFLVGSNPSTFSGNDEIKELWEESIVIATADHYHYGIAYGSGQYSMDPSLGSYADTFERCGTCF